MPFYEFRCKDCRRKFDIFMSYSDYGTKPVVCKHCQSQNERQRLINKVRSLVRMRAVWKAWRDPANLAGWKTTLNH